MGEPFTSDANQFAPQSGGPGEDGGPVLAVRNLFVHFDLGFDRETALRLAPQWVGKAINVGYLCAALSLVILLYYVGPAFVTAYGIWKGILFTLLLMLFDALLILGFFYLVQSLLLHILVGSRAHRIVKAVDGVSIDIHDGETLGLVGESGCGKSTLGRAILRLTEPTGGQVMFRGGDLARLSKGQLRGRRRHLQMIFQDPYASLNPRMTVSQIISEPIETFALARGRRERESRVRELMQTVGLSPRFVKRYPHEFSGGQRQRIGIARALAADPDFVVADEPISALDVSIQAQIMNLMERLQRERKLTYLFISHDLRAIRHVSDRVAVMYLGKLVELADAKVIYRDPLMPYTKALISAVPVPDPVVEATRQRIVLQGDVPSPINPPTGCRFHTRCPWAIESCKEVVPPLAEIKPNHFAACIRISPDQPDIERVAPGDAPGLRNPGRVIAQ